VRRVAIHVVGAGGMLGQDIVRASGGAAVALTRAELDVTDPAAAREALAGATVINCAAYTDVDGAESHRAAAHAVNEKGARNVAEAAGRVLYLSTDYVFDGSKGEPYVESDATAPIQEYGRSKLAGERATADANPDHLIVRSSWLFGAGGRNFVETMLGLAGEPDELRVVDDQVGCPTFTGHLAEALLTLAGGGERGILHVTGAGSCSWFEFAREIVKRAGVDRQVQPCPSHEVPRPARRPAYSVLGSERGSPALPAWQDGLDAYLGVRA
jgi:dTDP-4-dehydrorhamnose reductase